jgi:parvulin-like peptidyl-prolyl isomerase
MLMQKWAGSLIGEVAADEAEVRKYYDEHQDMFKEGERARVSQILLAFSAKDPEEKREIARQRIEEALGRLNAGEDFAELAKEYSQTTNASKGGDVGFFPRGVMVPAFEEMAFSLEVGEVSPVFETPYGYNIIKKTDYAEPSIIPFEEIKPTLTLRLIKQKEGQILQKAMEALRAEAEIEVLESDLIPAKPETDSSAESGGAG